MRILAADAAVFVVSQLRFIRFLWRCWWMLCLICGFLLWRSLNVLPALPVYSLGSAAIGLASYYLLLHLDLRANTASLAFGLLIMLAMWPLRILSGAHLLGDDWQLLLTIHYLASVFFLWGLAVPFTRASLDALISQKNEFLQRDESNQYQPRELKPTLDFARLRRHRDRQENQQ